MECSSNFHNLPFAIRLTPIRFEAEQSISAFVAKGDAANVCDATKARNSTTAKYTKKATGNQ